MNPIIANLLSFKDLSDDIKLVAQSCGLEIARALIASCQDIQVHVPRQENIAEVVRRSIRTRTGDRSPIDSEIKAMAIELWNKYQIGQPHWVAPTGNPVIP